jgi:lipoprotein Spr
MDIPDIIEGLRKKYEQSYGFAVFDLETEEKDDGIVVRGKVLTQNQKAEALLELRKASDKKIEEDIQVLSDPASQEAGWALVTAATADQKSRFVPNAIINEKIRKRICASQLRRGDVVRVLYAKEDQILVQSGDLTLGWLDLRGVEMKDGALRERWLCGMPAIRGSLIPIEVPVERLISEAERFLGVRYSLGAKSEEAIDCSGFTQSVYKGAFGIILPKHSWDQKEAGVAVDLPEAETGDLIFLINKAKGTKHVGIWEEPGNILHASFSAGKVVRQKAGEVLEEYDLAEIRRIIKKQTR